MKACARFNKILIAGYFLNALLILDVKFAALFCATYIDGMTGDPPLPKGI